MARTVEAKGMADCKNWLLSSEHLESEESMGTVEAHSSSE